MRATTGTGVAGRPVARPVDAAVRLAGAGLLLATGAIHLHLWQAGYRFLAVIGPLFLANAVLAALAAIAVLGAPRRWLPWAALLGGLLELGTLGGLLLSLTVGLFGFTEVRSAPLVVPTIAVEAAGFLLLCGFAARRLLGSRQRGGGAGG